MKTGQLDTEYLLYKYYWNKTLIALKPFLPLAILTDTDSNGNFELISCNLVHIGIVTECSKKAVFRRPNRISQY